MKKKIEQFDPFGERGWKPLWTSSLKALVKNALNVDNDGFITQTHDDGWREIYFMMTDKFGHTYFYRMDEDEFYKQSRPILQAQRDRRRWRVNLAHFVANKILRLNW